MFCADLTILIIKYMRPKRSHMVKFFFWVSSRDYFVLDPRPLRAVKITQLHPTAAEGFPQGCELRIPKLSFS
jgi:hypothetical protein